MARPQKVRAMNRRALGGCQIAEGPRHLYAHFGRGRSHLLSKRCKYGTDRADGTKREGDEPEDKTNRKKSKRTNKNKEKIQKRLEAKMAKEATVNIDGEDADDEDTRKGSRVRSTIQKPIIPSKVGIQPMYEAFNNARNKNIITK